MPFNPDQKDRFEKQTQGQNIADIGRSVNIFSPTRTLIANGNRMRSSLPRSLFATRFAYDEENSLYQIVENVGGSVAYNSDDNSVRLTIGPEAGNKLVRSTNEYFHYQSYRESHFGVGFTPPAHQNGQRLRGGSFYERNGIFLERDIDGTFYSVRRSAASGQVVDERVAQKDWNMDTLDGSGDPTKNPSGINLNLELIQMLKTGFEWYGAGDAWIGFKINRDILLAHVFTAGNNTVEPIFGEPTVPIRWEIENIEAVGQAATLRTYGASANAEAGDNSDEGFIFSIGRDWNVISAGTTLTRVLTIRPKATFKGKVNRVKIEPAAFTFFSVSEDVIFTVRRDVPITNAETANWQDVDADSAVEYAFDATGTAGGRRQSQSYTAASSQGSKINSGGGEGQLNPRTPLVIRADGTIGDINLAVFAQARTAAGDVSAGIGWKEIQ